MTVLSLKSKSLALKKKTEENPFLSENVKCSLIIL